MFAMPAETCPRNEKPRESIKANRRRPADRRDGVATFRKYRRKL